ncbi:hypothetical protein HRbin27_00533 [bacterium HR27]|nr:hypothetical protein HRbin27_00533 [bacterium HR27]
MCAAIADVVDNDIPPVTEALVPAGVLLFEPSAITRRDASHRVVPDGLAPVPDPEVCTVVPPIDFRDEVRLPVPWLVETEIGELVRELLQNPLVHELFEGHHPMLDRHVVVHRQSGQQCEDPPSRPKNHVDQALCFFTLAIG